jgi:2-succinyl-5-enolpyruvyl-6-hydroxy-3-cyclohexene-1-carboxylate synthase
MATLVDEWARAGVTDAVVCPGNRSTMLSAILEQDARIRVHVMVDERCASFFALGLAKATGKPAVFWCTSGTAAAQAHAAVIEAHYAQIPLLVCTANRPPELQHVRDWQSIDQSHLYEGMTRWDFAPAVADPAMRDTWRSIGARSVSETMFHPCGPGPVHLDLAIREPWQLDAAELPPGRTNNEPWHEHVIAGANVDLSVALNIMSGGARGAFVVGEATVDRALVYGAAEVLGWPVFAEARSGCRYEHDNCITTYDSILRSDAYGGVHQPEVVIHFGTPSISKALTGWIAKSTAREWLVDPYDLWSGSKATSAVVVQADPNAVCRAIIDAESNASKDATWLKDWQRAEANAKLAIDFVIRTDSQLTEPNVARALATELGPVNLFAATSMPVRDVEAFSSKKLTAKVFANRGASGMDGLTSTAAGIAIATGKPTVFLTGDLSFLYDLNALWALQGTAESVNMTIVVVDNNGGGIFSTLSQLTEVDAPTFERVVATPQRVDIPAIADALGAKVEQVRNVNELIDAVRNALAAGGIRVVYVATNREENALLHRQIYAAVADAVS